MRVTNSPSIFRKCEVVLFLFVVLLVALLIAICVTRVIPKYTRKKLKDKSLESKP